MNDMNQNMLPVQQNDGSGTAMSLVMNRESMELMTTAARLMASAKVTIPKHLQGSEGDCMAVIMQSAQWKMNPFAVAQKTHISQSGALGYEAQLVNAVIVSCGAITGQPEFEFIGDWDKILGKVVEKEGRNGGKYFAAAWSAKDEEGLGVIVTATLAGETSPRSLKVMLTQCYPRFSTQWATDPQQQITYVGVRKFARRYAPGAILGVYTKEELDSDSAAEIDVTPRREPENKPESKQEQKRAPDFPDDRFTKALPKFKAGIEKGDNTVQDAFDFITSKGFSVTEAQRKAIEACKPPIPGSAKAVPGITYADIAEKLNSAKTMDTLDEAADLIGEIADAEQRKELGDLYNVRRIELEGK